MLLSMEYGDFKPHEADAFELDHMIAYKQSSKFNLWNILMEVNLKITRYTVYMQGLKYTLGSVVEWMK